MARKDLLGRREPPDFEHVEKWPLAGLKTNPPRMQPVVLGLPWYASFDKPVERDGRHYIGTRANLGALKGGMAFVAKPDKVPDLVVWWEFYDQGQEPASVGFAVSRLASLANRRRYDGLWLDEQAREAEPGPGTTLRSGMDVLRSPGARIWNKETHDTVKRNRWATSVDEIREVLASPRHDKFNAVPLLASWGRSYPHVVWLPYEALARLLGEGGEATVATAR